MDTRHDLSVDHARLLATGGGYAAMDSSASGHPSSQQMRPQYGDLCRSPVTDASTLSAAYHSRYLASMPLSTGSTFPFLGGMFTGALPGPPTSPFRAPSTPGVNNMRFWPPTPPPEGYGRYSMNTSLFPLFGAPSPDSAAYLSQGLISRLGSTTHLSPVIDHKEHSFFTHGIGLGSPLTPNSHVTPSSPFPHLIPSLERHPAYIGHMTLGGKDFDDTDEVRLMKNHMDCLIKHNIPQPPRQKPKSESKLYCEKSNDDCYKLLSPSGIPQKSKLDSKNHHKVHPCNIEVSHSPSLKHDLLSPPIDSPKLEVASPCRIAKKPAVSPVPVTSTISTTVSSLETRCSQCCATMKDLPQAVTTAAKQFVSTSCPTYTVSTLSTLNADTITSSVPTNTVQVVTEQEEETQTNQKSPETLPVITITDVEEKPHDQSLCKSQNTADTNCVKPSTPVTLKHVTAAVIPTAPKQTVHRDVHPETNYLSSLQDLTKECPVGNISEVNNFNSDNHSVKIEQNDASEKTLTFLNQPSPTVFSPQKPHNKSPSTSCKVKDMIRSSPSIKLGNREKPSETKNVTDSVSYSKPQLPISPNKSVPLTDTVTNLTTPTNLTKNLCPTTNSRLNNTISSPVMKAEMTNGRLDCEFSQKSSSWSKATVLPFNWQNNSELDDQAINLTVSKKSVKAEAISEPVPIQDNPPLQVVKMSSEGITSNIGVCHPNPSPVAVNKVKGTPAVSSISNFSSISVLNQPSEQATEVHILHRTSKSSFPMVNRNATPPVPLKSTISHVTANTSIHRAIKSERLISKRGKLVDVDKLSGRGTLATLAPKLSKSIGFGKESQTSHTLSTSSSVSSTSIVFPATVNPCIPVGIAIAQQRQDTSTAANTAKSHPSVPISTPNAMTPNQHLASSRVAAELQAQELLADQKNQDLACSNNPTPVESNLLVTQGPTIISRQWESEALTRTAIPSASWLTHGSVVAPAVWLSQGAYTAAPTSTALPTVPSIAMNPLEPSPISLPPGGYQLARDSLTGHLLLIPATNIEVMDRPSVWPSFNTSTGNIPVQQLVTHQQHTQFEHVLPHPEPIKTEGLDNSNITTCDISAQSKVEEKVEDISGQVPSVPLATGQTYAFTTFPTQCDPSSFSYVLQSSTVMHLAHTQTASSTIQTESGRRSQGTSPLHCATPSPPPNTCSVQVFAAEDEEESDNDSDAVVCAELSEVVQSQSVTTAIQVDMDSQTNSEEEEEEEQKIMLEKTGEVKVEMSDSANQTESVTSDSPKPESEVDDLASNQDSQQYLSDAVASTPDRDSLQSISVVVRPDSSEDKPLVSNQDAHQAISVTISSELTKTDPCVIPTISIKEDVQSEPEMEIVLSETELAPLLPVESKPVMDFIDHHGLNLLVDSIEEFASRGQEEVKTESLSDSVQPSSAAELILPEIKDFVTKVETPSILKEEPVKTVPEKFYPMKYKTIDTSCTDGLGLLCALAEQRFFEEALNDEKLKPVQIQSFDNTKTEVDVNPGEQSNSDDSMLSSSSSECYQDVSESDMRAQLTELQKKYRQKQRELELLRNKRERDSSNDDLDYTSKSNSPKPTKPQSKFSPAYKDKVLSKNSAIKPWHKNPNKLVVASTTEKTNATKAIKTPKVTHAKVPRITLVHESRTSATNGATSPNCSSNVHPNDKEVLNHTMDHRTQSISSCKNEHSSGDYDKDDKNKTPVFDEQAWFVRRSERIFLSDARSTTSSSASDKNSKKIPTSSSQKVSGDNIHQKDKKETFKSMKLTKGSEDSEKRRGKSKPPTSKAYISDTSSSDDASSSDSDDSDDDNENMPLSSLVEHAVSKSTSERVKRHSVDSACSDLSSGQSEDIPLSLLVGQKSDVPELKSCILQPTELQENARLLVLDEGLFYAGYITKSEDPDMYGILIDGDRAARPHLFSKEEILNAAVLEVKPTHKLQLPEGSRVCAFWSQQYRCLYPGTVTKASSPMPDPSLLYVEFDDGDSGRIPLSDIRMLPIDFPIVSMEPNPFMILGKRRSRAQSQNSCGANDGKSSNDSSSSTSESKRQKTSEKSGKKSHTEIKCKETMKRKRSPSASNHSRSSSNNSRSETKASNQTSADEHKKKKPKDNNTSSLESKPKKHKKHKEDHHKHHHHHHHKHHHKKHKTEKQERRASEESALSSNTGSDSPTCSSSSSVRVSNVEPDMFILENSKTDLTFKIKKSPSPHTNPDEISAAIAADRKSVSGSCSSSSDNGEVKKKVSKPKVTATQNKPAKRKERVPSIEKSKIAAFLPVRQLWRWSGKSFRRPGAKGKAKKEFFRAIQRGKECIRVGDCAVFLSTGRPHLPYIGRIETMWESWGGKMDVKVKWFYHPEETKSGKKLSQLKGALFQSPHFDENDVQTISHKCEVLSWDEYQQKKHPENKYGPLFDNNDTYFLAGTYDPILGTLILEPGVPANPPLGSPQDL